MKSYWYNLIRTNAKIFSLKSSFFKIVDMDGALAMSSGSEFQSFIVVGWKESRLKPLVVSGICKALQLFVSRLSIGRDEVLSWAQFDRGRGDMSPHFFTPGGQTMFCPPPHFGTLIDHFLICLY